MALRHRAGLTLGVLMIALACLILAGWTVGRLLVPHVAAFDANGTATVVMTGTAAVDAWTAVSWLGSGALITIAGLGICGLLAGRKAFDLVAVVALGILGSDVLSRAIKLLVDRPRPAVAQVVASGPSFPSGHATESAAFYGVLIALAMLLPLRRDVRLVAIGMSVALMLAVAYSRVALGVHYPTDVIAGLLIGAGWAAITVIAVRPPAAAPWRGHGEPVANRGQIRHGGRQQARAAASSEGDQA